MLHVNNKKSFTSNIGVGKSNKSSKQWCHFCNKNNHNMADCREITKDKQQNKALYEDKAVPGKKSLAFLLEEINAIKRQLKPPIYANFKKRKVESLLSTEINSTTSSDADEEYFAFSSSFSRVVSQNTKIAKTSHPTSELVVSLNVNHEEHLLRALADTGDSNSIIMETYISKPFNKNNDDNETTWSTIDGQFIIDNAGLVTFSLPDLNLKKQISWVFHMDGHSESSSTYDMVIGQDLLG
jgi:hypothetical protein